MELSSLNTKQCMIIYINKSSGYDNNDFDERIKFNEEEEILMLSKPDL
jgi:hypothetical protein